MWSCTAGSCFERTPAPPPWSPLLTDEPVNRDGGLSGRLSVPKTLRITLQFALLGVYAELLENARPPLGTDSFGISGRGSP